MPALANVKHEAFCQLTLQGAKYGWSQGLIYQKAGYTCDAASAAMAASRLMKTDKIKARLAELTAPAVRKTQRTVDALAEQFDRVFDGAVGDSQWGAAGSAAGLKAKLLGFMREKIEVGGPGAFDQCDTLHDVAKKMIESADWNISQVLEAHDALREEMLAIAAEQAIEIIPPTKPTTFYERMEEKARMFAEIGRKK